MLSQGVSTKVFLSFFAQFSLRPLATALASVGQSSFLLARLNIRFLKTELSVLYSPFISAISNAASQL